MDASPDQMLVSRLVDDVAADASWDAFCELAEQRPELWRTLAEVQRDQALLTETVTAAAAVADRVPVPARLSRVPTVALTWSGWAAAAIAVAVLAVQPLATAPPPGPGSVQQASLAEFSPAEALRAYIDKGKEAGHVIEEYPSKMLVDVRPEPSGEGYRLIYFRPILEQTRVPDLFEVSGQDDRGNPRFVRYEPPARRPVLSGFARTAPRGPADSSVMIEVTIMRTTCSHQHSRGSIGAIVVAGLLLAGSAFAGQRGEAKSSSASSALAEVRSSLAAAGEASQESTMTITFGEDQGVFDIRIENGRATVKMNGKELPPERVRREDGRLIILDEHGNELKAMDLWLDDGPGTRLRFRQRGEDWREAIEKLMEETAAPAQKVKLGVQISTPGPALEYHLGLEPGSTTMIAGVYSGLPAAEAGLGEYDIIVAIDGESSADPQVVQGVLEGAEPGEVVTFDVIRKGQRSRVKVTIGDFDARDLANAPFVGHEPDVRWFPLHDLQGWGRPDLMPLPRRMLVDPGGNEIFEDIVVDVPGLDDRIRRQLRMLDRGGAAGSDQEEQIDRLERRLEELTERLNQLLEERDR